MLGREDKMLGTACLKMLRNNLEEPKSAQQRTKTKTARQNSNVHTREALYLWATVEMTNVNTYLNPLRQRC